MSKNLKHVEIKLSYYSNELIKAFALAFTTLLIVVYGLNTRCLDTKFELVIQQGIDGKTQFLKLDINLRIWQK